MLPLWRRDFFKNFWWAFICRYDTTNSHWFTFGLGSRYVGHSLVLIRELSADSMQFSVMSDSIWSWIGLELVSCRPTYVRYITGLRPTDHLPSVSELRLTCPQTLPDKTDTTPTYNQQTTDNLFRRDFSNMFERSLLDSIRSWIGVRSVDICPIHNRSKTDRLSTIAVLIKTDMSSNAPRQNRRHTDI